MASNQIVAKPRYIRYLRLQREAKTVLDIFLRQVIARAERGKEPDQPKRVTIAEARLSHNVILSMHRLICDPAYPTKAPNAKTRDRDEMGNIPEHPDDDAMSELEEARKVDPESLSDEDLAREWDRLQKEMGD